MSQDSASARLTVRLTPRGGANRIDGWRDGVLLARVRTPAVDGRANYALIALLAGALGLRESSVRILRGQTARTKVLSVEGLTQAELDQRLEERRSSD